MYYESFIFVYIHYTYSVDTRDFFSLHSSVNWITFGFLLSSFYWSDVLLNYTKYYVQFSDHFFYVAAASLVLFPIQLCVTGRRYIQLTGLLLPIIIFYSFFCCAIILRNGFAGKSLFRIFTLGAIFPRNKWNEKK